jgi:hypothetical protein
MPGKAPSAKASEAAARQRYAQIDKPEISFERFVELEGFEAGRMQALAAGTAPAYKRGLPGMTPCGGGDFENSIDQNQWQGAYGVLQQMTGTDPFVNFTGGILGGPINAAASHQTWVSPGADPTVGIPRTAPGSAGAVRIGNTAVQYGVDLLSKTFTVTAGQTTIRFWYAVILQNPAGHLPPDQPYFWVRVTDTASGTIIPGAVDLGGGTDKIVSDPNNPFLQSKPVGGETVLYKNWTCAQINLASAVGKQVTVEFVAADCGLSAHWGYAYVDNFCGSCAGSPTGDFNFNAAASSGCGRGTLCFDYSLPVDPTGAKGSISITLDILQNGVVATTLSSGVLTSGTRYCFQIDPATLPGIDPALGGFDFVATGAFKIGTTILAPLAVGSAPAGLRPGSNNDYQLACKAFSYAVKFVCGTQSGCGCACGPVLPGIYATEINIYNPGEKAAEIVKYVIPVVFAGAASGREPHTVVARAEDRITLPPHAATMDDCCRLTELLVGPNPEGKAPLSIGYLEIVSRTELTVTAVYTASGPDGGPVSVDVEQIVAKSRIAPPPRRRTATIGSFEPATISHIEGEPDQA